MSSDDSVVGHRNPDTSSDQEPDVPFGQVVFDNVFLWLALGVAVPVLFYLLWGLIDIASTPLLPATGTS